MVMFSIIIPARNEGKRIGSTLEKYVRFFRERGGSFEILVIMDACTDNTLGVVRGFAKKCPKIVKYRYYGQSFGKGGALIRGIKLASGGLVAYADADGATPAEQFHCLRGQIRGYDGIIGSRWLKGSRVLKRQGISRLIASRGFNLLVRLVLGLPYKDTQCSAKIFRRDAIRDVVDEVKTINFAFDASLLYLMKRRGYRIREVPITWSDVEHSSLRMRRAVPSMLWAVMKLRLRGVSKN